MKSHTLGLPMDLTLLLALESTRGLRGVFPARVIQEKVRDDYTFLNEVDYLKSTDEWEDELHNPESDDNADEVELETSRRVVVKAWQEVIASAEDSAELPQPPEAIGVAITELRDRIWYERCHLATLEEGEKNVPAEIWKKALSEGERIRQKYGQENLGPYTDFEWGMMNGKLSALRWVLGDEWDQLDT